MSSRRIVLAGLLVVGTVACEILVGIGDQPHLAGDASSEGGEAGVVCTLPTTGDAQVRLANLVPSLDKYDFCLTAAPSGSPSAVFGALGNGCPTGLLYRNVLAPFNVPAGTYRIDAIAPGTTCSSTPLATAPSVNFDSGTVTTVALFGTGGQAQLQLKSFREEKGSIAEPKVRFINGWSDGPSTLECGATTSDELPATIISAQLFGQNASFGNVSPATAKVDALGYFTLLGGVTLPFGFGETGLGTTTGVAVARNVTTFGSLSTFAIGTTADPRFPVDLMVCNQEQVDGLFTRCSNQIPDDVIVDVYNAQLQGRFTPIEPDRRQAVFNAVAALDSDFACITEVWDPNDQQSVITAAKPHFPFAATFNTDFTTVANDPRDQQGNTPAPYTTPPCDSTSGPVGQQFLQCLANNCTTGTPGDLNGQFPENATQCIISNCLLEGANLIATPACYSCNITQLESGVTFANTQSACTTNPLARYAFNGGLGIILLSTRQFLSGTSGADAGADAGPPSDDAPGLVVFPSTEFRAAMIRAPVDLTSGSGVSTKVDVYCAILTTPATSSQRPYTGNYGGGGATSADQWLNENILQATRLTTYVEQVSGARKRRAIVAGDYYTGPSIGNLQALNIASYNTLSAILPLATAPDYPPECTFCGDNPLVATAGASTTNIWSSFAILGDLAVPEVIGNTVIVKDLTASTNLAALGILDGGTLAIPPSFYYGMRTVVRVRP